MILLHKVDLLKPFKANSLPAHWGGSLYSWLVCVCLRRLAQDHANIHRHFGPKGRNWSTDNHIGLSWESARGVRMLSSHGLRFLLGLSRHRLAWYLWVSPCWGRGCGLCCWSGSGLADSKRWHKALVRLCFKSLSYNVAAKMGTKYFSALCRSGTE